jgi:hypothetical protein
LYLLPFRANLFMDITILLRERMPVILDRCLTLILDTYPPETAQFLRREKDRFQNPVWYTISREMEILCQQVAGAMEMEKVNMALENIIRVRAVQDFSPSQAIAFVSLLKRAMREEILRDAGGGTREEKDGIIHALNDLDTRIEQVLSAAFDIYTKTREKIYELRIREIKSMSRP